MILTYYCAVSMILIAYLLGSIPNAVWIGKKYYGIDIRDPDMLLCCLHDTYSLPVGIDSQCGVDR